MNEQFFSQWGGLIILFALCINLFFYGYINWKNLKADIKSTTILDISTITAIFSLLFLRIITVIAFKQGFLNEGWKMITDLFSFADGKFAYTGLILGLIFSIYIIFKSSNQLKSVRFLLDKITISFIILSFIDMSILGLVILTGNYVADPVSVIAILLLSLITGVLSRIGKVKQNCGLLSALFILLTAVSAIGINVAHSIVSGVWQIEFESIIALALIVYGIMELISSSSQTVILEDFEEEGAANRKTRFDESRPSGSPLKYSQSYAKNDDVLSDLSVREKVVSRINNIKRRSK